MFLPPEATHKDMQRRVLKDSVINASPACAFALAMCKPGLPGGRVVKNPPANAGGTGPIPGSGRSPGEGNGSPVQDSCLGNPRNRRA